MAQTTNTGFIIPLSASSLTEDIRRAMDDYEAKTCLTFKERTHESDYIHFQTTEAGCYSYVGRIVSCTRYDSKALLSRYLQRKLALAFKLR